MLLDALIHNIWLAVVVWEIVYIGDYAATLYSARLLDAGANRHITHEGGLEMTPEFQEDIRLLRWFSRRFLFYMAYSAVWLVGVWWMCVHRLDLPQFYEIFLGAYLLDELPIYDRHIQNILRFRYMRNSDGVTGSLVFAEWFGLRTSAVNLFTWSLFFLFFLGLTGRWFFLGGAVRCLCIAMDHHKRSRAAKQGRTEPEALATAPYPTAETETVLPAD